MARMNAGDDLVVVGGGGKESTTHESDNTSNFRCRRSFDRPTARMGGHKSCEAELRDGMSCWKESNAAAKRNRKGHLLYPIEIVLLRFEYRATGISTEVWKRLPH